MHRRELVRCVFGAAAACTAPMLNLGRCRLYAGTGGTYSVRAVDLVQSSTVVDMLGFLTLDWPRVRRWHAEPASFDPAEFAVLRSSGIDMFHPAVDLNDSDPHAATRLWLTNWKRFISSQPSRFSAIGRAGDLENCRPAGRVGILLGMQNSSHFRTASDVADFWALGQRLSQLTYNGANRIGYGCTERLDRGLTKFGESIIGAMNASGMLVDVSHAGERTTLDAFAASSSPVLITHSNCKALVPHPRCKSDTVIRAMARKGGVMGITYIQSFLRRSSSATLEDALDHFDHAARVSGIEHLGVGSDTDLQGRESLYRGTQRITRGLNHPRRIYNLAEGLLRRRYIPSDIALILGGNFLRIVNGVWAE